MISLLEYDFKHDDMVKKYAYSMDNGEKSFIIHEFVLRQPCNSLNKIHPHFDIYNESKFVTKINLYPQTFSDSSLPSHLTSMAIDFITCIAVIDDALAKYERNDWDYDYIDIPLVYGLVEVV